MYVNAFDITVIIIAVAVVSVVIAIVLDRRFYQEERIKEWKENNEHSIIELQKRAADLQNMLNGVLGQLLVLGIKLPRETAPAIATPVVPDNKSLTSEKRYE